MLPSNFCLILIGMKPKKNKICIFAFLNSKLMNLDNFIFSNPYTRVYLYIYRMDKDLWCLFIFPALIGAWKTVAAINILYCFAWKV